MFTECAENFKLGEFNFIRILGINVLIWFGLVLWKFEVETTEEIIPLYYISLAP